MFMEAHWDHFYTTQFSAERNAQVIPYSIVRTDGSGLEAVFYNEVNLYSMKKPDCTFLSPQTLGTGR